MDNRTQAPSSEWHTSRFAALRVRDYRLYWISLFLSNIGTWMQITAVSWLLYRITGSPLLLGLNGLFRAVPAIALGMISGTLADRYDRKKLMLITQSLLGLMALLLGWLDHSENIQLWQIYAVTFLSATVMSCDGAVRQALFPSLVPRSVLPNAVALNAVLMKGPALIGPSLAGVVVSAVSTHGAFYANAASFLLVIGALLWMRTPTPPPAEQRPFGSDLKMGLQYLRSHRVILGVIVMEATTAVFGLDNAMLTIFASDVLRIGAHGFGLLQSARGIGAVAGSSLFIFLGQRSSQGKSCLPFFGLSRSSCRVLV